MKEFFSGFGNFFFLLIPILGILSTIAIVGILIEVDYRRWFQLIVYLLPFSIIALFYTLLHWKLVYRNDPERNFRWILRSFWLFFVACIPFLFIDINYIATEAQLYTKSQKLKFETRAIQIINKNNQTINLEILIADTPDKQGYGMMGINKLQDSQGMMYFLEKEEIPSFTMKFVRQELEEVLINKEKVITEIIETEPCLKKTCPIYKAQFPILYSIEVKKGFCKNNHIEVGNKVLF